LIAFSFYSMSEMRFGPVLLITLAFG